jgi:hypothetical protein
MIIATVVLGVFHYSMDRNQDIELKKEKGLWLADTKHKKLDEETFIFNLFNPDKPDPMAHKRPQRPPLPGEEGGG